MHEGLVWFKPWKKLPVFAYDVFGCSLGLIPSLGDSCLSSDRIKSSGRSNTELSFGIEVSGYNVFRIIMH